MHTVEYPNGSKQWALSWLMSALGQQRTLLPYAVYVRYWGYNGHDICHIWDIGKGIYLASRIPAALYLELSG